MAIRIKLNHNLLGKMRSRLKGTSSDVLSLVERAFEEQGSFDNIHEAVKNGTEYSTIHGVSYCPASTQIINMNDTLYLLTNRLMEVDKIVEFEKLTKNTYQIKNSIWE